MSEYIKTGTRFIARLIDVHGTSVVPSHLIYSVEIPEFKKGKTNKFESADYKIYLYDVLIPCSHKLVYDNVIKNNNSGVTMLLQYLSPTGEITSTWKITGFIKSVKFPSPSWVNTPEISSISMDMEPVQISIE